MVSSGVVPTTPFSRWDSTLFTAITWDESSHLVGPALLSGHTFPCVIYLQSLTGSIVNFCSRGEGTLNCTESPEVSIYNLSGMAPHFLGRPHSSGPHFREVGLVNFPQNSRPQHLFNMLTTSIKTIKTQCVAHRKILKKQLICVCTFARSSIAMCVCVPGGTLWLALPPCLHS